MSFGEPSGHQGALIGLREASKTKVGHLGCVLGPKTPKSGREDGPLSHGQLDGWVFELF